tara:strand:+ start:665 stop:985 length:321 start_codon:yes stop_codon:yes gene_type:complete
MNVKSISPIVVGGYRYKVTTPTTYLRDLNLWAQQDLELMEIKVRDYLPSQHMAASLLHEVVHAIFTSYHGGEQLPESCVESLAQGLYQVILDNPKLVKYVQEAHRS